MIISEKTRNVLSNFQTINQRIVIFPGHTLRTVSETGTVLAEAIVEEEFPVKFGIYDLGQLLALLSLHKDSDVQFYEHYLTIKRKGNSTTKFTYCEPSLIKHPKADGRPVIETPYVEFNLKWEELTDTIKAMQILKFTEIAVIGDGERLQLAAISTKDPDASSHIVDIRETDKVFKAVLEIEKLKLMQSDYFVSITEKGFLNFQGETVNYWLAVNKNNSSFE